MCLSWGLNPKSLGVFLGPIIVVSYEKRGAFAPP
jgi:hypothetical protein